MRLAQSLLLTNDQLANMERPSGDVFDYGTGSLSHINPGYPGSPHIVGALPRNMNCLNCAIATDLTLSGRLSSALPDLTGATLFDATEYLNIDLFDVPIANSTAELQSILQNAGSGARAIVFAASSDPTRRVNHFFNVVHQGGVIYFINKQSNKEQVVEEFVQFYILRTNLNIMR